MANLGDIVELTIDMPDKGLRVGMQGTIVHCHVNQAYEVEFTNDEGETLDFMALRPEQFIVVWRAKTQQWVPASEQAAALVSNLPDEAKRQVLDFARFLSTRVQKAN
jgi:hypothetical protein